MVVAAKEVRRVAFAPTFVKARRTALTSASPFPPAASTPTLMSAANISAEEVTPTIAA
jgi:hypothetical protein